VKAIAKRPKSIESLILTIRGRKVLIDADLATIYEVQTRTLNQAVRRNPHRFPEDFIFQLTAKEKSEVITNCDHLVRLKYAKALPLAFTEHGAIMAATVLNSTRAVAMSVYVVRAFLQMREQLAANREILRRLAENRQNSSRCRSPLRFLSGRHLRNGCT
jgi:ORF6N domain